MKGYRLYLLLGAVFIAASALIYYIHYLIFQDAHHIFIYLVGDLGFLPLEVFLVVFVIERILTRREKQAVLYKLNMVIGAFFSEIGNYLLADLLKYIRNHEEISRHLNIRADWTPRDFKAADEFANYLKIEVDMDKVDLDGLKTYLHDKRLYLLTLLENPSLLEHDRFTDLLWSTTHLLEELEARDSFKDVPEGDLAHLAIDIQRMYDNLTSEWLDYAQHLKSAYPFLFSLLLRTHPFQDKPSAVVKPA
ncbi:MAG: hypothetical protein MUO19_08080 [Dehalococcoidales bacterium]|nr:hypothetical protein [Dehalococcoidales bacterium]